MLTAVSRTLTRVVLAACLLVALGGAASHAGLAEAARAPKASKGLASRSALKLGAATRFGRELLGLRTRTSRTYLTKKGLNRTVAYGVPVNYRDTRGTWKPIKNRLVPSTAPGYAYENDANRYRLLLPRDISAPVRIEHAGAWLSLDLRSVRGRAKVDHATARYASAAAATTVSYTAGPTGVKEAVTLSSLSAPRTFVYDLALGGLTPRVTKGGIELARTDGQPHSRLLRPFMVDARGTRSNAVTMKLRRSAGGYAIAITPDRRWLASSKRRWPVVVDPPWTFAGADRDCYIANGSLANSNLCGGETIDAGWDGSQTRRALAYWSVNSTLERNVVVIDAQMRLWREGASTGNATSVGVHALTNAWGDVTWNRRDSDLYTGAPIPWNTPGGDFNATAAATQPVGGTAGQYVKWNVRSLVQGWVDGSIPNRGALLKTPENVNNMLRFSSTWSSTATTDQMPSLIVTWQRGIGLWSRYTFLGESLSDRLGLSVNVGNGNLVFRSDVVDIAGTGLNLSLDRYYNSLSSLGVADWRFNAGRDVYLEFADDSIGYHGPSGYAIPFARNGDGTYTSPTGINATLVRNADGTFTLTTHGDDARQNFDATGRLLSDSDAYGNKISYGYGSYGQLTSITDTQGRTTTLAYTDPNCGDVSSVTDPTGRVHRYAYNTYCDLISYTNPAGGITRFGWYLTDLVRITDPRGNATKLTYDYYRRVTSITRVTNPSYGTGPKTSFTYNTAEQGYATPHTVVTNPNGAKTTYYYDAQHRVTKVVDPLGHTVTNTLTANSDVETFGAATGGTTTNDYGTDGRNNLRSSRLATGATSRWEYTNPTHKYLPTKGTDTQGNATTFGYDAKGSVVSVTTALASQNTATYTYNANGTIATATDFKGFVTGYGYDAKGNLTLVDNTAPLGDASFTYDTLSRLTSQIDGRGQKTTYVYDALDRPTSVTFGAGGPSPQTITFAYDGNGNVTSMADNTGTTTYAYDALNRLAKETLPGPKTNEYAYDNVGNLVTFTDAGGKVSYAYDARNLLKTLTEPNGKQTTFQYDHNGQRTQTVYPNGVTQFMSYDAAGRTKRVYGQKSPPSGAILTDYTYTYTNAATGADTGIRQTVKDKDGNTTSYTYDALSRLTKAEERSPAGALLNSYGYSYDANSNRLSQSVNGVTTTYAYNTADQLTQAGSVAYTYDGNGNETGNSAGRRAEYNVKDQTTSATPAGGSAVPMSYTGPGQVRRVKRGTDSFTDSLLGLTRENSVSYTRDDDGTLLELRTTGGSTYTAYYYLVDGLGSIAAMTDAYGNVVSTYKYDPFGKVVASTGSVNNPWRFMGSLGVYHDIPTGLYKMGARFYDPELGRFTQVDPVVGGSANPYDYANQNPVNGSDVSGQRHTPPNGCGSGGASGRVPDIFRDACDQHDRCYGTWGSWRRTCDENFRRDMLTQCRRYSWLREKACNGSAEAYYQGVRTRWGRQAFINSQVAECRHHRYGSRRWCEARARRRAN